MTSGPTEKTWRQKITLTVIGSLISGTARAVTAKILEHLTSH
jgi:hypothetical protein